MVRKYKAQSKVNKLCAACIVQWTQYAYISHHMYIQLIDKHLQNAYLK